MNRNGIHVGATRSRLGGNSYELKNWDWEERAVAIALQDSNDSDATSDLQGL